jgi:hypothetical protein
VLDVISACDFRCKPPEDGNLLTETLVGAINTVIN